MDIKAILGDLYKQAEYISFSGYRTVVTTKTIQAKKHKKRRINKKWIKRYGYKTYDYQKYAQIDLDEETDTIYMNRETFSDLKKWLNEEDDAKAIILNYCKKDGIGATLLYDEQHNKYEIRLYNKAKDRSGLFCINAYMIDDANYQKEYADAMYRKIKKEMEI